LEKKFYDELKKKAEKSFDWSKEKNQKKIDEQIETCIARVKEILQNKKLVSEYFARIICNDERY
jgi:hypothetical protein